MILISISVYLVTKYRDEKIESMIARSQNTNNWKYVDNTLIVRIEAHLEDSVKQKCRVKNLGYA